MLRSLLRFPIVYTLLQSAFGSDNARKRYVAEHLKPSKGINILDIGCGPGTMLQYLPETAHYTGFDINERYILSAQQEFGDRGKFICSRVNDYLLQEKETYDMVLATGVVHHLDDQEALSLFQLAHDALGPNGVLFSLDPVFVEAQNPIARFLISRDRGEHVRSPLIYENLARSCFKSVSGEVRRDLLTVPYTHFIMSCRKAVSND